MKSITAGEATLLLTTAPIFTVVLSYFFLKEKLLIWLVILVRIMEKLLLQIDDLPLFEAT
jgi:drug/metabolite transporter (DMT)-like permease